MKSATGRWVSGSDFFDRNNEIEVLRSRLEDGNHVLLTGQRRMGKTSLAQELGCRLQEDGWAFLFADVEDAQDPQDFIAEIAEAGYPIKGLLSRFTDAMKNFLTSNIEEIGAYEFKIKIRAGLDAGSWKVRGEELLTSCAIHKQRTFLVIDELPIFLNRLLKKENGLSRIEDFLSWFRRQLQHHSSGDLVILVSGSIGLEPLVRRLGLSDRINHLEPSFRVGPWNDAICHDCLQALADQYNIELENGVPERIYTLLGIGIPHHIQSFFTRIREDSLMQSRNVISVSDVDRLYIQAMLGPFGQNDLAHYESRLKEALDPETHQIAMLILAEAATRQEFGPEARLCLDKLFSPLIDDSASRISDALDILEHDGYLHNFDGSYRFQSNLLRDWWRSRYDQHHRPICEQLQKG